MSEGRARLASGARDSLTARQHEVMELMAAGKTNFEIAQALGITLEGAKYHVSEILAKLGVDSREEAVAAWRAGERRWRWPRMPILVPAAAGIAALAVTAVLLLALLQDNDPTPTGEPEAWLAWVADDLDEASSRTELHIRRGSQPDVELFPETDYAGWLSPRWSPDGRYLAVLGFKEGGTELVLIERDTRNISSTTVERPVGPVAWKPDSKALSFLGESGVVTYDVQFKQLSRSGTPPAQSFSLITGSEAVWSPDSRHLALLAYGNVLVMNDSGEFATVDAVHAGQAREGTSLPAILIDDFQPEHVLTWRASDSFDLFARTEDNEAVAWTAERSGDSWRLEGPRPNPPHARIEVQGDAAPSGRLTALLDDGKVQAISATRLEEGRYNPGEPSHWAILHVVSEERVVAEFELANIILGTGSRTRDFDLVLVSD